VPPCPFCKHDVPTEAGFCPGCGEQVRWAVPPLPPRASSGKDRWPSLHALEKELGLGEGVSAPMPSRAIPMTHEVNRTAPAVPPAAARETTVPAAPQARRVMTVAPLWRRLLAWTVDAALLAGILFGLLSLGKALVVHGPPSRLDGLDYVAETLWSYQRLWQPAAILCGVLCTGYLALFTALGGQTPGKRLLGLSVIDRRGGNPGLLRSGSRSILALVSGTLMLMGFFLVLVDRRRQALHDKLSGTFVVMTPERG
jgi:uncharacterized RDD family membrane protein YckC